MRKPRAGGRRTDRTGIARHSTIATIAVMLCLVVVGCKRQLSSADRYFDSDGVTIRYQVIGEGPPVVLIHGFGERLERWHSSGVTAALARGFRVVVFDVRGHGLSDKPTDTQSYGRKVPADVVRLMEHVGATKAHIVGYSMGALIAVDVAVAYPGRVLSVVLGGAGVNSSEDRAELDRQADLLESHIREGDGVRERALAALLRTLDLVTDDDMRLIDVPVAALIGANDHFMPSVQRLSHSLPSAAVSVIPDADHVTARDHPLFAEFLVAFLRKHDETPSFKFRQGLDMGMSHRPLKISGALTEVIFSDRPLLDTI